MDIDFLADKISNDSELIKTAFENIFSIKCEDALVFDLKMMSVKNITEFKDYHGFNISIIAFLDKTRIPVSIDIGFGDVVYPDRVKMDFPVLLDMDIPNINAYSIYSVIAEKFEAIVDLGQYNSRYKDFYDIYAISQKCDLNGFALSKAIIQTFKHRNTTFDNIVAFSEEFIDNSSIENRWEAFKKKKKVNEDVNFKFVISKNIKLLLPIVNSIVNVEEFHKNWSATTQNWND